MVGVADVSAVLSKANTCEFKLPINNLAAVPSEPSLPCFALASDIVLTNWVLELTAVIVNEPLSCPMPVIVNVFVDCVNVTLALPVPLNVYSDVLLLTPSNTSISVLPPVKTAIVPLASAANVWFSFVKNVVTASTPFEPSEPSEPGVPSPPSEPPSTLNTLTSSERESLTTSIVSGKSALFVRSVNETLPLSWPLPPDTTPPNDGVLIVPPPALVIVILPPPTAPLRFCWDIVNTIELGVDVLSEESSKANTCESVAIVSIFALEPFRPAVPCLDLASDMVLVSWTLELTAVIVSEPLSWPIPVRVNVFPLWLNVTSALPVPLYV